MRIESLQEGARLALDQLRANKFRSGLTILGVVVGVATVMAMSAMIAGIRSSIMDEMDAAGRNNFVVVRFDWNQVRFGEDPWLIWRDRPKLTERDARRIEQLPAVKDALVGVDAAGDVEYGSQRIYNVQLFARDAGWHQFTRGTIVAGHNYLPSDVAASRHVVVISPKLADDLFGALDPIGRRITIQNQPFDVIGVVEFGRNIFASVVKHFIMIPHTVALKDLNVWDDMLGIFVITAGNATQQEAIEQVMTEMRTLRGLRPGEPNNFEVVRQQEFLRTFNRITGIFFLVMIALSSVALMVGGVGVIAIMMIAVTERTREIGVRKALGATQREILWQFLFEAATVTVIGAALGVVLGGGAAFLVGATTPIPARVPLGAVVAALVMATVAGILFGLWPAWRASRLDPVEALRHE